MIDAQSRRAARNLATSSKRLLWALKKKLSRGAKSSTRGRPPAPPRRTRAVGEGEGDLLDRGRPGLANVVARDRDCVPVRQLLRAVGEHVRHEAHRGPRRVDVGAPRDVLLQDVVLNRAAQLVARDALLLGDELVEQSRVAAVALMVIEVVTSSSGRSRPAAGACPRARRSRRRPCRLRPRRAGGRRHSPSGWAGRRRRTVRSGRHAAGT